MKFAILKTIFLKEMVDTLRDKRTLIAMIGIPMVLYPALLLVSTQLMIIQQTRLDETPSKVVVRADDGSPVRDWAAEIPMIELVDSDDAESDLQAGDVDAIVVAEGPVEDVLAELDTFSIEVRFDATESASREAQQRLKSGLNKQGDALLKLRLEAQGLEESFAHPIAVKTTSVAPPSKAAGMILGMILPMLMVTMLGVGAFYPAVDLTAGEKERGTFETLLSTPASKLEIVSGKFLTVFVLSMITGLLNLGSMVATIMIQIKQVSSAIEEAGEAIDLELLSIPPQSILAMLVIIVPLAFFISAVMMSVALLARSFKDAQNYVTPFFMVIILPAGIAAIPGIELTTGTQFIPIANIALLFRDLMMDKASLDMVFTVFICTTIYALLALLGAVWMFQREDVILSEEKGIPLTFRRDELRPRDVPTPGLALGMLVVAMLLLFYVGTYAQSRHLQIGLLITEYGVLLLPVLLILWFTRVNIVKALNLRWPNPGAVAGTLLMAPACLVLLVQASVWQNRILPVPEEFERIAEKLFAIGESGWGLPALLFVIAVSPALCEEVLFRGVLVSGLRKSLGPWGTTLVVGVLFGLFHLSIYRFVPTGAIGIVLTYIVVRSGSIVPGMIGHFIINASSVLLQTGHVPEGLIRYLEEGAIEERGLPFWVLGAAAVVFFAGAALVEWGARVRGEESQGQVE